ncbi:tyrosine-protein phosphatase non-receptor type 4-like [Lampris incognitus]|uniref:tyrosine-protein phosphatase non-receptor type 4-like n=1 Tax=Lampris incognitus TaxID=2546036 RepID=UPI0024B5496C|nr:tyrosine-protein phosphatase non-receptor type 4-like [Lampris incognitus]
MLVFLPPLPLPPLRSPDTCWSCFFYEDCAWTVMTARFQRATGRICNVRASKLVQDGQHAEVVCNVLFLDNTVQAFTVSRQDKGQALLDLVFNHLDLTERDYFGLQLADRCGDSQKWVDPAKLIRKQLKGGSPHNLNFLVKFFVTDPNKLQEEYTRYQYFLQIKRDILSGRLPCPNSTATLLASYAVQSELGDHSNSEHLLGYLSDYCFIPNTPQGFEKEVVKHHQQHIGLSPAQSELLYLNTARTLDLYGVERHYARDQSNTEIHIGVMSAGIVIYKNSVRINHFPWVKIVKISFKCRHFFIQLRKEAHESRETLLGFIMSSYRACKNLWKACVEHHSFFRLDRPVPPQKNFLAQYFRLGSKYRYSGRTEAQSVQYGKERAIRDRVFPRSHSRPLLRKMVSGVDFELISRSSTTEERLENWSLPPSLLTLKVIFINYYTCFKGGKQDDVTPLYSLSCDSIFRQDGGPLCPSSTGQLLDCVSQNAASCSPCHASAYHMSSSSSSSAQANGSSLDSNLSPDSPTSQDQVPSPATQQSRTPLSSLGNGINHHGSGVLDKNMVNGDETLVLIRMSADEHGRFGFNVKGGSDQKMPVIVSRVTSGTAADLCVPRLNEGDQVVRINGQDILELTHDQVVSIIKNICEERSGELTLLVRPNAIYEVEDEAVECDQPVSVVTEQKGGGSELDTWRSSMQKLKEALASGAALAQFEQLYRKKPGLTMTCARLPHNISKNRYRDISPYDATRVILKGENDYINANYINIPLPGTVNRYIACQGPLPGTCADFWQMTWEQGCPLLVMLTTQVERGRVKCHQYWPHLAGSATYSGYQVSCASEEGNSAFVVREMTVTHLESHRSRPVTQLQYLAWPDHGVPEDSTDFLALVGLVRNKRQSGEDKPVVVHCSAGIGRTGVLITMETALCLMECSQPVYPLDIVKTMREQRAMMIQTPSQYRFVCEAILKVHEEGLVKPTTPPQRE